jgi:hypothetical protein
MAAAQATIDVNTSQQGVTPGQCSFQEAIYSAELATNIALSNTDPTTGYTTGCVPGTGNGDTIVLQAGVTYTFTTSWGDAFNYMGPTATPIIFKPMVIQGNGATLEWTGTGNSRLFAVGSLPSSGLLHMTVNGNNYSGSGELTLQNVYVKGFHVKGGNGRSGGGGGLGAGGAIFVDHTGLSIVNSTFDSNGAVGGNGTAYALSGGGGGGLSGNGGVGDDNDIAGGGGGGSRGNGGDGLYDSGLANGGGGGGTLSDGSSIGTAGRLCGGTGGVAAFFSNDGENAQCLGGGGGGGGGDHNSTIFGYGNGANGSFGGGGGGSFDDGGNGGFGGGGGGSGSNGDGGNGGFGAGGGAGDFDIFGSPGSGGGSFGAGDADGYNGGGGNALGGAIFSYWGTVSIQNSTFTANHVTRGAGGGGSAQNGLDAGGAIFAVNGSLTIVDSTISGNQSTASRGGIAFYTWDDLGCGGTTGCISTANVFDLENVIIANDGPSECSVFGHPDDNLTINPQGNGNLIMQNDSGSAACAGVVSSSDPGLQSLQFNSPGDTPTMAILANSSAVDTADSSTSLPNDQRGVSRPQMNGYDIGAYEARPADFSFAMLGAIPVGLGGTVSVTVTVNSFEYFTAPVTLSVPTMPPGVSVSFSSNPVMPSANGSASTTMTITLAPTLTPGSYTPIIQGNAPATATSAALMHSLSPTVVVSATAASISTVINDFVTTKAIDDSGIAQALNSKLTTAQAYINMGDKADAISTLGAMINQLNAQSGKHVTAPAASVLITDTEALQSSLH